MNYTQCTVYYCSDDIKLCCCRKHCVMDTSRPYRGNWSCWSGCVEPYRRREMIWTTGLAFSRNRETKKHQPILKLNQWSLYPGRKRMMKMTMKKTMRRACHRMMGWKRRASTKLPDHLNWTLIWQLGMKPLLFHQAAVSLQRWRAHCRTEPAHRASEEASYAHLLPSLATETSEFFFNSKLDSLGPYAEIELHHLSLYYINWK